MGLSCCKSKKYKMLDKASHMKTTELNKVITTTCLKHLTSRAKQREVLNDDIPDGLRLVLTPPLSNFDEITPNVFITGVGGMVRENIVQNRITCIINVTFEAPNYKVSGIECFRIPVEDDPSEQLYTYFNDVSDKINEVKQSGGRTVIHCVAGISRSSTFVLAYLIKYKRIRLRDAFLMVRQKRDVVQPKMAFIRQLIQYERDIFGKSSTQMIKLKIRGIVVFVPDFYETDCPDLIEKEVQEIIFGVLHKDQIMEDLSQRSEDFL